MRQAEKARIGSVLKAMHQIKQRKKRRRIIIGIGLLLSLAGLLVGCNTVERAQAGMIESLEVEIRPNDSKLFVYRDRKSTRLNCSHVAISYAVVCLKKE